MDSDSPSTSSNFYTDEGIAVPMVSADLMREIDRMVVEETGPNLYQMMENAGWNTALQAIDILGEGWSYARVVVLAGPGGNGGGGVCAARHLANRGVDVGLCLASPGNLCETTDYQRMVFQSTGGNEVAAAGLPGESVDLIVDALLGYNLQAAPTGIFVSLIQWANASGKPILSLDIPTGVDASTGETPGEYIQPRHTLALALPKSGLHPGRTGELFLTDIGIPSGVYHRMGLPYTGSPFGRDFRIPLHYRSTRH
ncbi:MAG: NAD(P)H-hydrate epimerase [Candidatus Omnitrophica bacterium]|nr:NAD(P)H-hydrate epimerase [Candidatus Omnitrophota bacterium]